jgi:hypothetical protein
MIQSELLYYCGNSLVNSNKERRYVGVRLTPTLKIRHGMGLGALDEER